jgi:photosynthetic reaction center cytochrome c subunit
MQIRDRLGRSAFALLLAGTLAALAAAPALAQDLPAEPKNLQVLPKTTTIAELKTIMVGVASAMGQKCSFCHNVNDYASDEIEHKRIARGMMTMVNAVNAQYFSYEGAPKITCYTCHRGAAEPVHQFELPKEKKGSSGK